MNESDEQFEERAKARFDESVDGLDGETLSRLNRSRQAALAAASKPGRQWSGWMSATGVAAGVLIAVMVVRGPAGVDVLEAPASDLEILLSDESIDMLEELEFYSFVDALELEEGVDVS